jgi:hypothetical protein
MPRMRMSEIIERFVRDAGKDSPEFYSDDHLQGIYRSTLNGNDTIFSYGRHFPLAEIMPADTLRMGNRARTPRPNQKRGWWLLNGDRWAGGGGWGASTSGQQTEVQRLVRDTGLPFLIVPFSALDRAGISHNSIRIVDQLPDRYTWEKFTRENAPNEYETKDNSYHRNFEQTPDGRWSYEAQVHHLGEAVFTADYQYWTRDPAHMDLETHLMVHPAGQYIDGSAHFLSAFDENEPGFGLYFLAQLPDGAEPSTVAEAREALKPNAVVQAERQGLDVLRQGDVFAIPRPLYKTGRDLPGPSERMAFVLGVNHQVTEVRKLDSATYGRGVMRHKPREWGRQPEHRALKLGDGKTWYLLARNTVPEGRSWSVGGNVD